MALNKDKHGNLHVSLHAGLNSLLQDVLLPSLFFGGRTGELLQPSGRPSSPAEKRTKNFLRVCAQTSGLSLWTRPGESTKTKPRGSRETADQRKAALNQQEVLRRRRADWLLLYLIQHNTRTRWTYMHFNYFPIGLFCFIKCHPSHTPPPLLTLPVHTNPSLPINRFSK